MSKPISPPYALDELGMCEINGHLHTYWSVAHAFPERNREGFDGIGVCVVLLPKENDCPKNRARAKATAEFIVKACNECATLEVMVDEAVSILYDNNLSEDYSCPIELAESEGIDMGCLDENLKSLCKSDDAHKPKGCWRRYLRMKADRVMGATVDG